MNTKFKDQASTIVCGMLLVVAAILFWLYLVGNPIHEFALIRNGQTVAGAIVDTWEDAESGVEGGTTWTHFAIYSYRLPDGREFTARTKDSSGGLKNEFRDLHRPYPIAIEYLPDNPRISRIKGAGCQSVFEWVWRTLLLGGLILALLLSPGCVLLRNAFRNIKRIRAGLLPLPDEPGS